MPQDLPATERELLAFIHDELGVPREHCLPDMPLFSSGLLDSFALVELLAFAEARFGVSLLDDEAVASLDTARALARHVQGG